MNTQIQATIKTARNCLNHLGDEPWAIKTICEQSGLDVRPTEVTVLRNAQSEASPTGMRWVMSGGTILGSYLLQIPGATP